MGTASVLGKEPVTRFRKPPVITKCDQVTQRNQSQAISDTCHIYPEPCLALTYSAILGVNYRKSDYSQNCCRRSECLQAYEKVSPCFCIRGARPETRIR